MRKEEATCGVVWVGWRLAELVVDPVVPRPHQDRVLHGDAVGQHQEDAQGERRLVGSVRPEPVGSRCYALESGTSNQYLNFKDTDLPACSDTLRTCPG